MPQISKNVSVKGKFTSKLSVKTKRNLKETKKSGTKILNDLSIYVKLHNAFSKNNMTVINAIWVKVNM